MINFPVFRLKINELEKDDCRHSWPRSTVFSAWCEVLNFSIKRHYQRGKRSLLSEPWVIWQQRASALFYWFALLLFCLFFFFHVTATTQYRRMSVLFVLSCFFLFFLAFGILKLSFVGPNKGIVCIHFIIVEFLPSWTCHQLIKDEMNYAVCQQYILLKSRRAVILGLEEHF